MNELPVPAHYQQAAEEVRAQLCLLRGGAPFLSPQDSFTLVSWLDAGVAVPDILLALERAADARRKSRSRFPLTLGTAKRHLGKPAATPRLRSPGPGEPPLGPLLDGVPGDPVLRGLLSQLRPGDPTAELRALAAIRAFLDERWVELPVVERETLEQTARLELDDLLHLVDEDTGRGLVEETARDLFRQRWPGLSASAVRHALHPES